MTLIYMYEGDYINIVSKLISHRDHYGDGFFIRDDANCKV